MITIARIHSPKPALPRYQSFLDALGAAGFQGERTVQHADRTVAATDNSIYQRQPEAVVFPRNARDVEILCTLLGTEGYSDIVVTPRGGGTGTNGQSLTNGIVVDLSRHMNNVLEINVQERWVRVQAGVVKDQLNRALAEHGLFFAPELSTSNRATIGGMISTDASGQGSCSYGKTRDHVLELDCVLLGGDRLISRPMTEEEVHDAIHLPGRVGQIYRTAHQIATERADEIEACFPDLNRCLTGYDLAHLRRDDGGLDLNSVLCGSEGSLGVLVEARLNVLPIPKHTTLVNIRYASFMDALRDARALLALRPLSIETVDSKVLGLAKQDIVWHSVSSYFPENAGEEAQAINLVEFSGDDDRELSERVSAFVKHIEVDPTVRRLGHTLAHGQSSVTQVYAMRKRAVGLLGNVQGEARPQPFVEDTAVPPERLADFIAEFRDLLDSYHLSYGMFGHVDAGVLHVRPALDMKRPEHAALIRPITDAVYALTRKYGGLLWGEHGKGVRSEYTPHLFGELYSALQDIKAAFDPYNQLNPGKIASPSESEMPLLRVDEVTMRGDLDRTIPERVWESYGTAMHCNGNGACYNFDPDDVMCPSWKSTRQRVHSPKGRATLIREWLRLQNDAGVDVLKIEKEAPAFLRGLPQRWRNTQAKRAGEGDFSHEVYDAMAGCLACKSCVTQCPVKVNVPDFRSRFLQLYHTRYLRPLKDYVVGSTEFMMPYLARTAAAYNAVMRRSGVRRFLETHVGLSDTPLFSRYDWKGCLRRNNVRVATSQTLAGLSDAERARSVIVVQDAFTRYFDTPVMAAFLDLASALGYQVFLAPFMANGKPLHVHGFMRAFERVARRNAEVLSKLASYGVPLVGVDPAMTLVYRQEYLNVAGAHACPRVLLVQEWLITAAKSSNQVATPNKDSGSQQFRLMAHCTEKTGAPDSVLQWQKVYESFGLELIPQTAGCCGMSGTYGHDTVNVDNSKRIFEMSWGKLIVDDDVQPSRPNTAGGELLATGFSCRSQTQRFAKRTLRHPVEALLASLTSEPAK